MSRRFVPMFLAALAVVSLGAGVSSAGGRFTLISSAACVSGPGVSQGFVWWSGKDPSRAVFTFQPSGQTHVQELSRFQRADDYTNFADFGIGGSTSVDIVLTDRKGNSLASVSGVPCQPL